MKKLIIFVCLLVSCQVMLAQTQFQATAGSAGDDLSYKLIALPGGNLVATGSTNGIPGHGWDSYLIKFSRFGEVLWSQYYGDTGNDDNWDLTLTQNKQLIGVGTSTSLGTPFNASTISRTDTSGVIVWLTGVADTLGAVEFYRVIETGSGHLLATGLYGAPGNQDNIVLCKFNPGGQLIWSKSIGSAQSDEAMGLAETGDGHYLLAGVTSYSGGNGSSDFAVVKTDTAGNVVWSKNYGGTAGERLNDVMVVGNSYYFLGWSSSAGAGNNDIILMKTDQSGVVLWVKAYGTTQNDRAFNMLFDERDSTLMIAGYTDYSFGSNNRNTLLIKTGLDGNMVWAKSYGSNKTDGHWPTGLAMNSDRGYYLLGVSNSFTTAQDDDLYLVKTNASGNTACFQKDPQLVQAAISNWAGTNFGASASANFLTIPITHTGTIWPLVSNSLCCQLYADAGPDVAGCPSDSVQVSAAFVPGYSYNWVQAGVVIASGRNAMLSFSDSGTVMLNVWINSPVCDTLSDFLEVVDWPQPQKPVVTVFSYTLTSTPADHYQWLFNGDSIQGATGQTYFANNTGYYSVMVTNSFGCNNVSDTVYIHYINAVPAGQLPARFNVYPNPSTGLLYVVPAMQSSFLEASILSPTGQMIYNHVFENVFQNTQIVLNPGRLDAGLYTLVLKTAQSSYAVRLIMND